MFPLPPSLPPRTPAIAAWLLLVGTASLAGCDSWPRYNHLDEPEVIENQDPRASVLVSWTPDASAAAVDEDDLLAEDAPQNNGNPANVTALDALAPGQGHRVAGTLEGVGWNGSYTPDTLVGGECGTATVQLDEAGYWAGDIDFFVVEAPAGTLCARALMDVPVGFDLLVMPLDECGLPLEPLRGGSGLAGQGLGGSADGMQVTLPEGGTFAVLFAGYDAEDPNGIVTYELGISLVDGASGPALCPYLPAEGRTGGSE